MTDGDRARESRRRVGPRTRATCSAIAAGGRNVRRAEGIYSIGGKVTRPAPSALTTTPRHEGTFEFAGVDTHYFISAAVKPGAAALDYHPLTVPTPNVTPPDLARLHRLRHQIRAAPRRRRASTSGRRSCGALQAVDPQMVPAIWFGMFSFLSVPLLAALNWINGFVGNYGWSILVLTVLINAVMFPLRHKSFVSMRKMQEIQPQVKMIQDRYAKLKMSDPARQKMNTELMDLYRSKGVNPASGCIPMLLTLPGPARVLRTAVRSDRAPRRAVHVVDSRSVGGGSVLRDADSDGPVAAGAAAHGARRRRIPRSRK